MLPSPSNFLLTQNNDQNKENTFTQFGMFVNVSNINKSEDEYWENKLKAKVEMVLRRLIS